MTMRNLMTHTPGWEESIKELFVANQSDLYPIDEYLKKRLPKQIYPPGTTPAYSNYGARWRDTSSAAFRACRSTNTSRRISFSRWAWATQPSASRCPRI